MEIKYYVHALNTSCIKSTCNQRNGYTVFYYSIMLISWFMKYNQNKILIRVIYKIKYFNIPNCLFFMKNILFSWFKMHIEI